MIRTAVLVLYSIYAFSPIYLSTSAIRSLEPLSFDDEGKDISIGIVWVNIVLSSVISDDRVGATTAPLEVAPNEKDPDFFLIKKKRAVLRHTQELPAPEQTSPVLLENDEEFVPAVREYMVVQDLRHRLSNSSHYLHIGLSPPLRFV
ncbi:MAG: hypothetical protein OEW15_09965 [Nitrospirota bacterium]|nr:hypothetical protein [Nitrospirota bacterium]